MTGLRLSRSPLSLLMASSMLSVLCYVAGQGISFATQLLILHVLDKERFALIGIAQMCVLALIFIGELGMPSYFIRETRIRTDWVTEWRRGRRYRLAILALGSLILLTAGQEYFRGKGFGFYYLVGAVPGIFCSAFSLSPILIGQNRLRRFALGIPLQTFVSAACSLAALYLDLAYPGLWLGLSFSAGLIAQYLFQRNGVMWPVTEAPADPGWQREMLRRTLTIWGPGLFGMAYTLLLTFSIEELKPELVAYFILANQVMQGVSGINMQVQRIFLPAFAGERHDRGDQTIARQAHGLLEFMILSVMTGLLGLFFATASMGQNPMALEATPYFCLILTEWLAGLLSSFLVTSLLAAHREHYISRVTIGSFLVSIAVQFVLLKTGHSLIELLLVRLVTNAFQLVMLYRAVTSRNPYAYGVCALGLLAIASIEYTRDAALSMVAGCVVLTTVIMLIFGQRCWKLIVSQPA